MEYPTKTKKERYIRHGDYSYHKHYNFFIKNENETSFGALAKCEENLTIIVESIYEFQDLLRSGLKFQIMKDMRETVGKPSS